MKYFLKTRYFTIVTILLLGSITSKAQEWEEHHIKRHVIIEPNEIMSLDLENDGDMDIIISSRRGVATYYENLGDSYFSTPEIINNISTSSSVEIDTGDINNDGFTDILISSRKVGYVLNNGDGTMSDYINIESNDYSKYMYLKDIDNDGWVDIIGNEGFSAESIIWYRNLNGTGFSEPNFIVSISTELFKTVVEDFDNDGDFDVLYETSDHIKLMKNDGDGNFAANSNIYQVTGQPFNVGAYVDFQIADLNNDAFPELVVLFNKVMRVVENDAGQLTSNNYELQIEALGDGEIRDLEKFDYNQDGFMDILGYRASNSSNDDVFSYFQNNNGTLNDYTVLDSGTVKNFLIEDLDQDGDLDWVITDGDSIQTRMNTGSATLPFHQDLNIKAPTKTPIFVDNFKGGQKNEILTGGYLIGSENNDNDYFIDQSFHRNKNYSPWANNLVYGDVTGDGIVDLVNNSGFEIVIQRGLGEGEFVNEVETIVSSIGNIINLTLHDINLDGKKDLVYFTSGNPDKIHIYYNDFSFPLTNHHELIPPNGTVNSYKVEDIDGDGRLDFIYEGDVTGSFEFVTFAYSKEDSFVFESFEKKYSHYELFDFDNDGDLDFAAILYDNGSSFIEFFEQNNGEFSLVNKANINADQFNHLTILPYYFEVTDIDGDNNSDFLIIGGYSLGSLIGWYAGKGGFEVDSIPSIIFKIDSGTDKVVHHYDVADLDLDGDLDIIAGYGAYYFSWFENPFTHPYKIAGKVFYDLIDNGVYDEGEPGIDGSYINVSPSDNLIYTYANGNYFVLPESPGNYEISNSFSNLQDWQLTSDQSTYDIELSENFTQSNNNNFGYRRSNDIYGLQPNITTAPTRCDLEVKQWVLTRNIGSFLVDGVLAYTLDSLTSYVSSNPMADSLSADTSTIYWNFENISYNEHERVEVILQMPNFEFTGDTMAFIAKVDGYDPHNEVSFSNTDTLQSIVRCSYDPNDKLCSPEGVGDSNRVQENQSFFDFTIRFQNTGNDVAYDVVIEDELHEFIDINAIEIIGNSHPMTARIQLHDRKIIFSFNDIYLPDSITDEANSHGFVKFRAQIVEGIQKGDFITNKASIFFDSNPPVVTNEILRTFGLEETIDTVITSDFNHLNNYVSVTPNPFSNYITIGNTEKTFDQYKIINLSGVTVEEGILTGNNLLLNELENGVYILMLSSAHQATLKSYTKIVKTD